MPKTQEEILADIAKAVEGQGNQGAIAIAPILKDIVELAGEGGGGESLPKVVIKNPSGIDIIVETTADTKAIYDAVVANKVANFALDVSTEVIADLAELSPLLPTTARAILGGENNVKAVVAIFYPFSGTQIIACTWRFEFASDGAVTVTSSQYAYTIGE